MSPTVRDLAGEIPPRDSIAVHMRRDFERFVGPSLRGRRKKWKVAVSAERAETGVAPWSLVRGRMTDGVAALEARLDHVRAERHMGPPASR